jgi:NADH dehydrogenase FAD-containing subunit
MKRLVLLGGGHAHVGVLAALAQAPLPGWQVEMVTPFVRQIYSGMLPGWLAGQYGLDECAIALKPLLWRAGVTLRQTAGVGLHLDAQCVRTADGQSVPYDLLSIDTGPMPALVSLPGAREHAQPVRPIEDFVAAWPTLTQRIARAPALTSC